MEVTNYGNSISSAKYTDAVVIPESVSYNNKTYRVTGIGSNAFLGCTDLVSVTIPNSVTSIGDNAFSGCNGLQSLVIGNGVTSLQDGVLGTGGQLESLTIGSGVLTISNNVFRDAASSQACKPVKTIWLTNTPPSGYVNAEGIVNLVSNSKYESLSNKTVFQFLSSYFTVGGIKYVPISPSERTCASVDCVYDKSITSISINKTVSNRGINLTVNDVCEYTFHNHKFIKNAVINHAGSIGKHAFQNCNNMESATIGNNVESIGNNAFDGCSSLLQINIPDVVKTLGSNAFQNCASLTSAKVGQGIDALGNYTFAGCSSLSDLQMGNNVKTIGTYVFSKCSALSKIFIPKEVTNIGDFSFNECSSLKEVIFEDRNDDTILNLGSNAANPLFSSCPLDTVYIGRNITYNTSVEKGYSPFYSNMSLRAVMITNKVKNLTNYEFAKCKLENVWIYNNGNISSYAFLGCKSLSNVKVANKGAIEKYAFQDSEISNRLTVENEGNIGASAFTTISGSFIAYINIDSLGNSAFNGSTGLTKVDIGEKVIAIGDSAFINCSSLASITIGNNVESIGNNAFDGCSSLLQIEIPDVVKILGSYAFQNCTSLTSAKVGQGIETLGDYTFAGCTLLADLQVGNNVKTIRTYVFSKCSALSKIFISKEVKSIGDFSFNECSGLKEVIIEDREDLTELGLGSNGSYPLFYHCPLDTVYIGGNISYQTIANKGYSPFYRNTSLRSVVIANMETEISENEFYGCTNLKNVYVGDGVTKIGNWAFSGCSSLGYFEFGSHMATIGKEAFSDCTVLTMIVNNTETPPVCGVQALDDINKWNCTLKIPYGTLEDYQSADQWKDFFFVEEVLYECTLGDVDDNGKISVTDAVRITNYIIGRQNYKFLKIAADVDENRKITVNDYVILINDYILGDNASEAKTMRAAKGTMQANNTTDSDYLYLDDLSIKAGETLDVDVYMQTDRYDIQALQCEIVLPEGLEFVYEEEDGERYYTSLGGRASSRTHTISDGMQSDGSLRVVEASASGSVFKDNSLPVFTFTIKAKEDVTSGTKVIKLANMELSYGVAINPADREYNIEVTGTAGINNIYVDTTDSTIYYDLQGRKVKNPRRGIYIHNGKKVMIK